jgi:hypothetical protein
MNWHSQSERNIQHIYSIEKNKLMGGVMERFR